MFLFKERFSLVSPAKHWEHKGVGGVRVKAECEEPVTGSSLCPHADLGNHSPCVWGLASLGKDTFTCTGAFSTNCFRTLSFSRPLTLFHFHNHVEIRCLVALISVFQHYLYSSFLCDFKGILEEKRL